jgi:aerobic-type carbon monoxide dehydrogenase small subunit (CoxS/CutS family)
MARKTNRIKSGRLSGARGNRSGKGMAAEKGPLGKEVPSTLSFNLNGRPVAAEIPSGWTLLEALRRHFRLTGSKEGCGEGECGACTVLWNGEPANACLVMAAQVHGTDVVTIEGLSDIGANAPLHAVQQGFIDQGGVQCGFCIPGMIVSAAALLQKKPKASLEDIKAGLSGNICRCTGYEKIFRAVEQARDQARGKSPSKGTRPDPIRI